MTERIRGLRTRVGRIASLLSRLFAWQAAVQVIGLISGFALLRWLNVEGYAQYTLAFGFVTAVGFLIDLGFGQAVIALVGDRADDDKVTTAYIAAARRLRNQAMMVLLPGSALLFALMTADKDWTSGVRLGLFASVAITIVARSFQDFYGLRLILQQNHGAYMRPQVVAGAVRLLALGASRTAGILTSVVASLLSSLLAILPAIQYRRRTGSIPARGQHAHQREIISYALPLAPMLLYTGLQSQAAIFVVSTFGSIRALAEVGALSRLGQIYALAAVVNILVIAPKLARAPRERLGVLLAVSIGGSIVFAAAAALAAFLAPGPFVALLGNDYRSLRGEIGGYLAGVGLAFVSGVVFTITAARGYIYWWLTNTLIVGVFAVQGLAIVTLDLSTVPQIVIFVILTGGAQLLVALAGLWYGLKTGPRPARSGVTS